MKHLKFILPLFLILFACSPDSDNNDENTRLELTILDENNQPVENVEINLYTSYEDYLNYTNIVQTLVTDVNGKVTFESLEGITYYWETFNNCYIAGIEGSVNPITSNTLNSFTTNIDSNFFGNISISNNSVYDYNLTYTGPVNGTIRVNALTSESLISLPVGIYAFERTPINSPNPTTIQNNITVNCGIETMFNFN
jgi:hypothetical protein